MVERAYLAGFFLGDGCWSKTPTGILMRFCGNREDLRRIVPLLRKMGAEVNVRWVRRTTWVCTLPEKNHALLIDLGMTPDKLIPLEGRSEEFLAFYLSGHIDADGHVGISGSKIRSREVSITSADEGVRDQALLCMKLLRLEARAYLHHRGGSPSWKIRILGPSWRRLESLANLLPRKQRMLTQIVKECRH